jgi:hypothetical protein
MKQRVYLSASACVQSNIKLSNPQHTLAMRVVALML